jgi:hypothetical protein
MSLAIIILAWVASLGGIFSSGASEVSEVISVHGERVRLHGIGLYRHMAWDTAVQGIAQDWITAVVACPLLMLSLILLRRQPRRARVLVAGTLLYFLLTYLFYLTMASFNEFYLIYTLLLGLSLYAFLFTVLNFPTIKIIHWFEDDYRFRLTGGFMMLNPILIGLMWFSVILIPLLKNEAPVEINHYTTLIVQGLDLAIFLPLGFAGGYLQYKKHPWGYVITPVYLVFLSLMMTALSAKLVGMSLVGVNTVPAIFIIPVINVIAVLLMFHCLLKIKLS